MKNCLTRLVLSLVAVCAIAVTASAQVTTGSLNGKVQNATAGRRVRREHHRHPPAVGHDLRNDLARRWPLQIINMRVGGPYSVTVAYTGTGTAAFAPETVENVEINLGVATDLNVDVKPICRHRNGDRHGGVRARCSARRAPARRPRSTARRWRRCRRCSGRISDFTRLTPQTSGTNSFGGAGQPHEQHDGQRRGLQQLVRPRRPARRPHRRRADLARSDRAGAGQHRALRRAPGQLRRRQRRHRHPQRHQLAARARSTTASATRTSSAPKRAAWSSTPARSTPSNTGGWAGAPIVKNRLFVFGNFENETDARPLSSFRANNGGEPVGGNVTRVLASDMANLSSVPEDQLQLRHRLVRSGDRQHAAEARHPPHRLQPEREQQVQLQLRAAQFELGQPAVGFDLGRHRPPPGQHRLHELPELELPDPREPQDQPPASGTR